MVSVCARVHAHVRAESHVDIKQSVRHKDVFIIQSGGRDVNNSVMELLIMIYACKTSCARSVNVVMPYMPYSKQCKMWRRGSIVGKLVAEMICKAGAHGALSLAHTHDRRVTFHHHGPVSQGGAGLLRCAC